MPTNKDISRTFALYAELLLLHGRNERLSDLLSGASYRIRNLEETVGKLGHGKLTELFHPIVVKKITDLETKGSIDDLEELVQLTPSGLFDMMRIKGLGGKKLSILWKTAKIDNVEDLLQACKSDKLSEIPGFGTKTEKNIIAAIEAFNNNAESFHYADVADVATNLVASLQKLFQSDLISLCGEVRRQKTVVEAIEVIADVSADQLKVPGLKKLMTIAKSTKAQTNGHTLDEIPVTIYHTTSKLFYENLFIKTGNLEHVEKIQKRIKKKIKPTAEEDIYKAAGFTFIQPEMRENVAEWQYLKDPKPLLTDSDIKGVVHNHTDWSDGVDRLKDFVEACKKRKYEYVVISDHSQNAHYAGGLKPDKVLRQFEEIDKLNKALSPFKIFKSIECDILVSGDLDYDKSLLKQFDLVIVSIHQLLKMNEQKATARIINAIENPYTTILGHMTGRQLLIRPGYPLDFKKVIDACAANKVVIEVNANPYRLDMDWSHIPYALEKGVMISINPDAHSIHEIDNIRWGVSAARKGGLTKDMTWNAMTLPEIKKWLKERS